LYYIILYCFQQHPYHLHAVLVHEGQAASGHYWAFIYDQTRSLWLKFNDVTVSQASWEEIERESIGGYHNASAYCLMYVDRARIQNPAGNYLHYFGGWVGKEVDITISLALWEEIERESIGGYPNASAYCLMYVDRSRTQNPADNYTVFGVGWVGEDI
jgi:hypothetical protein